MTVRIGRRRPPTRVSIGRGFHPMYVPGTPPGRAYHEPYRRFAVLHPTPSLYVVLAGPVFLAVVR